MGLDRNTVIGMVLIGLLMFGMFFFNNKDQAAYEAKQKHLADSAYQVQRQAIVKDSLARIANAPKNTDTTHTPKAVDVFAENPTAPEQLSVLENSVVKVTFTNKGGQPKSVELKQYKTFDGKPVILQNDGFSKLSYSIHGNASTEQTSDLNFTSGAITQNADKSQSISFTLKDSTGKGVTHTYTLRPDDYMVDLSIKLDNANKLVDGNVIPLLWQTQATKVEKDLAYEKRQMQVGHIEDGSYDFDNTVRDGDKQLDKPVDWVSVKQQFFITAIAAEKKFQSASLTWVAPQDTTTNTLLQVAANLHLPVPANDSAIALQLYYGPSDYHILSKYSNGMYQIVPYGSGPFAFVKYINRHVLLPVFDFIKDHVASMGIVILLLTLFIRLLTSPILYKSYVSGAKMKALKPEVDKLRAKFGDDKQGFSMEQMKLWKSAGVSPLGGCLPALLQVPIFMSLYYFFQSNIALRGQGFLWSKDLASYDSIFNFGDIPVISSVYGNHVSLFTLTAVITSLLISLYSMSNVQDQSNPVMKYMPYIFPVLLLGVFNRLPSALTWYYTISNTITLLLQIVIQRYIIDHDKILAQIEENRKKPVKMSKLQQRMQEMQESNKKLQDMKNKSQQR